MNNIDKLSKENLLDEAIRLLEKAKGEYGMGDLNLDVRRFRNKLMDAEIMPGYEVEECVARLHDFLLDFRNIEN